jgi:hypothetical protein
VADLLDAAVLDARGLFVVDSVDVSAEEPVGDAVPVTVCLIVTEPVTDTDTAFVFIEVPVIVLVLRSLKPGLRVIETKEDALGDLVCVVDRVAVFVITEEPVFRIDLVPDTETVDVLDDDVVLVNVVDPEFVLVGCTDCVGVLVDLIETVAVTLVVEVFELVILRVAVGDDEAVLDDLVDCVPVTETAGVFDIFVVFVNEGEAEEVFEDTMVLV